MFTIDNTMSEKEEEREKKLTSLQNTQHDSQRRQLLPVLDKAHTNHDTAPQRRQDAHVNPRANLAANDGAGRLKNNVRDEKQQAHNRVPVVDQLQLRAHARNVGRAQVGPVHQRHAVHGADRHDQPPVNVPLDALLLGGRHVEVLGSGVLALGDGLDFGGRRAGAVRGTRRRSLFGVVGRGFGFPNVQGAGAVTWWVGVGGHFGWFGVVDLWNLVMVVLSKGLGWLQVVRWYIEGRHSKIKRQRGMGKIWDEV